MLKKKIKERLGLFLINNFSTVILSDIEGMYTNPEEPKYTYRSEIMIAISLRIAVKNNYDYVSLQEFMKARGKIELLKKDPSLEGKDFRVFAKNLRIVEKPIIKSDIFLKLIYKFYDKAIK